MASEAPQKIKEARHRDARGEAPPPGEPTLKQVEEERQAEFHGPTTAMLDSMQPFDIEGGEGIVHQMQARHAAVAMRQALKDAMRHVTNIADVRPVIQRNPWATVGGAAVLGFVAATLVVPSPKQRAAGRLRAIERALRDEAAIAGTSFRKSAPGTGSRLLRIGWRLARPTLLSMITGALSGAATGASAGSEAGADSGHRAGKPTEPPTGDEADYGTVGDVT